MYVNSSTLGEPRLFAACPKKFARWNDCMASPKLDVMIMDFTRVLLGLAITLFHVQLADFLRKQDRALAVAFRERGVPLPDALPKQAAHNLFFLFGVAIALFSLARIWVTLH
jgi:hypothetical protein